MDKTLLLGLIATALAFAAPLLLAALGELIGERSGVLNIGLEGMMLSGALAGAATSFAAGKWFPVMPLAPGADKVPPSFWEQIAHAFPAAFIGLLGAMLAGMALAAIFALLAITLRADAVVVGTGLNLFALGITGLAHRALSACWGSYQAVELPPGFFMATGALLVPLLWWAFASTRIGLQVRAWASIPRRPIPPV
jgi:simple sugar transport system permease protein